MKSGGTSQNKELISFVPQKYSGIVNTFTVQSKCFLIALSQRPLLPAVDPQICKDIEDEKLQSTAIKRNRFVTGKQVHLNFGLNCHGKTEVTEREGAEEKVHQCMKLFIHSTQNDHSNICQEINETNNQKHGSFGLGGYG